MKDYELKNVWNADDTGHVRRALPAKSLSVSKGRCNGGKYAKQRIMVLLVVNTLGEKEPPVITGEAARNQGVLKRYKMKYSPVVYIIMPTKSMDGFRAYRKHFKKFK